MRKTHALLVALLASCGPSPAPRLSPPAPVVRDDRAPVGSLDDRVVPREYRASFRLDREAFSGEVEIDLDVRQAISTVWLHAKGLEIERAAFTAPTSLGARVVPDDRPEHTDGQSDLIGVRAPAPLPVGAVTVRLSFRGKYGPRAGLLKPKNGNGMMFLDLEPNDTRAVVPCFDEPRFKAPWVVSLDVESDLEAASNGPQEKVETLAGGRKRVSFRKTRPLSTYQLAFAAGSWAATETRLGKTKIRVLAERDSLEQFQFVAESIPTMLAWLERYFDEPFAYDKLDLLAIPTLDGHTGGMESPGLITIRGELMAAPLHGAAYLRGRAAQILAHELSHLWIGDLITNASWGELWLQEGGASFYGMKLVRELGMDESSAPFTLADLLETERKGPRHPIAMTIEQPADADDMFRAETYAGGAAVYATLESFLGQDALRRGMTRLVDAHRDGAFTRDDFVRAMTDAAPAGRAHPKLGAAVDGMLASRLTPTVTVGAHCREASPYLALSSNADYPIPVCARFDDCVASARGKDDACEVCAMVEGGTRVPVRTCSGAVLVNAEGRALYRTAWEPGGLSSLLTSRKIARAYEEPLERRLFEQLDELPLADRAAAAAYLASHADNPMMARRGASALELLSRAAPDAATRTAIVAACTRVLGDERPALLSPQGYVAPSAPLALFLALHGDEGLRRDAAALTSPDLFVQGLALKARANANDMALFETLKKQALDAKSSRAQLAATAIGAFSSDEARRKVRALVASRALSDAVALSLFDGAVENPAWSSDLADLLLARAKGGRGVSRAVGSLCSEADLSRVLAAFPDLDEPTVVRARASVQTCAKLREQLRGGLGAPR